MKKKIGILHSSKKQTKLKKKISKDSYFKSFVGFLEELIIPKIALETYWPLSAQLAQVENQFRLKMAKQVLNFAYFIVQIFLEGHNFFPIFAYNLRLLSNKNWKNSWIFVAFAEYRNFNGSIGIGEDSDKNSFLKEINSESVLSHVGYSNFELCVFSLTKLLPTKTGPKV